MKVRALGGYCNIRGGGKLGREEGAGGLVSEGDGTG